jgi:hypothetical protein
MRSKQRCTPNGAIHDVKRDAGELMTGASWHLSPPWLSAKDNASAMPRKRSPAPYFATCM